VYVVPTVTASGVRSARVSYTFIINQINRFPYCIPIDLVTTTSESKSSPCAPSCFVLACARVAVRKENEMKKNRVSYGSVGERSKTHTCERVRIKITQQRTVPKISRSPRRERLRVVAVDCCWGDGVTCVFADSFIDLSIQRSLMTITRARPRTCCCITGFAPRVYVLRSLSFFGEKTRRPRTFFIPECRSCPV